MILAQQAKLALCAFVFSVGCAVGPDYTVPTALVPERFHATENVTTNKQAQTPQLPVSDLDLSTWWTSFEDPVLTQLIHESIAANLDLRVATARVQEARGLLGISWSGLVPTVDSTASYTRSRASANGLNVATGPNGSNGGGSGVGGDTNGGNNPSTPTVFTTEKVSLYQVGFDAAWELDVFGGVRREIEASEGLYQAQIEARRDTLVTLVSELAQNYLALRGFQQQRAIVESNIAAQKETLDLQRLRFDAGITTDLTVAQAEALLATTQSQLPPILVRIQQAIHRLSVLLGREPTALSEQLTTTKTLPQSPSSIPPGLPSELLLRRADIRQAERTVAAATANIGVATADLFPKVSLTGRLGVRSLKQSNLLESDSTYWSYGPAVDWPIFSLPAIWKNIEVQDARQQQAIAQYQQTVLRSFEEVENALTAFEREQERRSLLRQSVDSSRRAVDVALQLNEAGISDFLNVLTAQQSLFQAENQLAQSELAVATNLVVLYKALGGGWEKLEAQLPPET